MVSMILESRTHVQVHRAIIPELLEQTLDLLYADPRRLLAFTDYFPRTADDWTMEVYAGRFLPFVWTVGGAIGGMYWFHDMGYADIYPFAWVGLYVAPDWRTLPHLGRTAWRKVRSLMAAQGLTRIFGGCRKSNRPAKFFAERYMGFTCLGTHADWAWFHGKLEDCYLFSQHREHQSLLWVSAEQRAEQARANGPAVQS